tara:strand:+ start:3640 stop:3831 length:192 start_codon:yes stop_codon:yes gene_type:complete
VIFICLFLVGFYSIYSISSLFILKSRLGFTSLWEDGSTEQGVGESTLELEASTVLIEIDDGHD